jgi:LCP family protein required for cell wall assembly
MGFYVHLNGGFYMLKMDKNKVLYLTFGLGFILLISASIVIGATNSSSNQPKPPINNEKDLSEEPVEEEEPIEEDPITGIIIGVDEGGYLTDVLMVGHLNVETNELKIISIPRDLFIDFREEGFKAIKENNPNNRILYSKLNEVYSYVGHDEQALKDLISIVEVIVGFDIDYYAKVDLKGFRTIVDLVGGVEFYVPTALKYTNEKDLFINIPAGLQMFDGAKAEHLVRYRTSYGDIGRIKVQREFLTALIDKVLKESDLQELLTLIDTGYDYVETNFAFFDALNLSKHIFDTRLIIDTESMVTIPTYGERIDGFWFEIWDRDEVKELIQDYIKEEIKNTEEKENFNQN